MPSNICFLNPQIVVNAIGDTDSININNGVFGITFSSKDDRPIKTRFAVSGQNIGFSADVEEGIVRITSEDRPSSAYEIAQGICSKLIFGDNLSQRGNIQYIDMYNITNIYVDLICKKNSDDLEVYCMISPKYDPFVLSSKLYNMSNPDTDNTTFWITDSIAKVGYLGMSAGDTILDSKFNIFGWHTIKNRIVLDVVPSDTKTSVINTTPYTMTQLFKEFKDQIDKNPAFAYYEFEVLKYNIAEGTENISTEFISNHTLTLAMSNQDISTTIFCILKM